MILLAPHIGDAFAERLTDFDFLRGNEAHKAQWARAERWTIRYGCSAGRAAGRRGSRGRRHGLRARR